MNPELDENKPRRAFSLVEVAVSISILGAASIALSTGFSTGDGIVRASSDMSYALRLASQQADLVRRQLTVDNTAAPMPPQSLTSRVRVTEQLVGGVPRFSQPAGDPIPNLRTMGIQPVDEASPFYLLNSANFRPAAALEFVRDAQLFRMRLYMTRFKVQEQPTGAVRDLGGRKVMACQVDVYKGVQGSPGATNITNATFLFSMSFLARRYDMDWPSYNVNGPTNAGFFIIP